MRARLGVAGALLLAGCAFGGFDDAGTGPTDAARPDAASGDAGRMDAGRRDAGGGDAGPPGMDAGGGLDAGPPGMDAGGALDAGPPMMDAGGGFDAGLSTCSPTPGSVEISEIMIASQTGASDFGEWFELRNRGVCPINLAGLVIDVSGTTHTVASGLLTAGGYFVFAQSGDTVQNHDLGPDYVYGTALRFSNGGGTLVLTHASTEVVRVTWTSTDLRIGRSRQVSNGAAMATSIGGPGWCDSTGVYSTATGGPYLGTPGMVNATCP